MTLQYQNSPDVRIVAVGFLVGQRLPNKIIAQRLGLGYDVVRRCRTEVYDRQLLTVDPAKVHPDVFAEAMRLAFPNQAAKYLKQLAAQHGVPPIKNYVSVYSSLMDHPNGHGTYPQRFKKFSRRAPSHLIRFMTSAKLVGLTYGETIQKTLEHAAIESLKSTTTFFPTCCDPYCYQDKPWGSSSLTHSLMTRLKGRHQPFALIGGLPVIPKKQGTEFLLNELKGSPAYKEIFGCGQQGLIHRMDTLITSIGRMEQPWRLGEDDYNVRTLDINREELHSLLDAEIGGVLIPKNDLTPAQQTRFDEINSCRFGMTLAHLEPLARRAATSSAPGVIVVAPGASKAECFIALVKRGLINSAVVDDELEDALIPLLRKELRISG